MIPVKRLIVKEIQKIVKDLTQKEVAVHLEHPKDERYGDYSSNIAMLLFQKSEIRNPIRQLTDETNSKFKIRKYQTPLELAQKIAENFKVHPDKVGTKFKVIERVEAAKPGFINFWLSKEYLTTLMIRIIRVGDDYGKSELLANKKIMLEFADPNPFKEFHVGHLRNITLGESYARLLQAQAATVWRVNYQGDVGLHVAKAIYGIFWLCHADQAQPDSASELLKNKILKQVQDDNSDKRIKFLGEAYAIGSKAYEESEEAKKEIQLINTKVYRNDSSIREIWEKGRRWSLEHFEAIYKRVDTTYKRYYFESEVAKEGRNIVLSHIADGIFEKSDGAVIFRGEKHGLHSRVFVTKEDYATYEAKDMALAPIKYKDFPYDKSIIITAHEQAPYFKVVLAAMRLVSRDLAEKTEHKSFGFVRLKDKKMSSRLGNIVTGEWLLDEAKRRIKEAYKDMDEATAEKVAVGAVKYSMLKFSRESDIAFDFDESISLEGNSGPYLQYTYARTQSILRKFEARNSIRQLTDETNSQASPDQNPNVQNISPSPAPSLASSGEGWGEGVVSNLRFEPEEVLLLRTLYRFPEVVEEAAENFGPNILCNYLFDLSQKFNLFYQKHPILESKEREFRLALTAGVGQIIKNGLYLLGIKAPERM